MRGTLHNPVPTRARRGSLFARLRSSGGGANRKLRQRRPLRSRLPGRHDVAALADAARAGFRRAVPTLMVLVALAVGGVGAWRAWHWLHTSPRFAVHEITVAGNSRVTADELRRRAAIAPGTNVLAVPLGTVEKHLLENPWIASAKVTRHLPGRIEVRVTERQPAGLVLLDSLYLVDSSGQPFKRAAVDRGEGEGLITITGLDRRLWSTDATGGAAAVREALDVTAHWRARADRPAIGELHVDRDGFTAYTLQGAVAVILGRATGTDLDARLDRFDVIWAALSPEERAATRAIHLDSATRPDRVTVKLADAR